MVAPMALFRYSTFAKMAAVLSVFCLSPSSASLPTSSSSCYSANSHLGRCRRRHQHLSWKKRDSYCRAVGGGKGRVEERGAGARGGRYAAAWVTPFRALALTGQHGCNKLTIGRCFMHAPPRAAASRGTARSTTAVPLVSPTRRSLVSMKARAKRGRSGGGGGGATAIAGRRAGQTKKKQAAVYIKIEDIDRDSWRLLDAVEILKKGGVGVIPTDTCYTFACDILSRKGVERILRIKNEQGRHKPLSLLCKDISTMNTYARGIDKALFKTMKAALPGPFTFILPSTNEVPRMLIEHKHHRKTWKRKEIGIRLPDAPVLLDLLQQLDGPLLCGSVPSAFPGDGGLGRGRGNPTAPDYDDDDDDDDDDDEEGASRGAWGEDSLVSGDPAAIEAAWGHAVDFVIDAGVLEIGGFSTVVDAVGMQPVVLREGLGDSSLIS